MKTKNTKQQISQQIGIPRSIVIFSTSEFTKILKQMYNKRCTWHFSDIFLVTRGKLKDFTQVEVAIISKYIPYIQNLQDGEIDLLVVQLPHPDSEKTDTNVWEYWQYQ